MAIKLTLPPIKIDKKLLGNNVIQYAVSKETNDFEIESYHSNRIRGYVLTKNNGSRILVIKNKQALLPQEFDQVLRLVNSELTDVHPKLLWLRHPKLFDYNVANITESCNQVLNSWKDQFIFREEIRTNEELIQNGLRPPQIGAIHAVLAHWTTTNNPATIVMPTGTGKTETMLGLLVAKPCRKLLVVVPTDPLRTQVANKFLSLGVLKRFGVVTGEAQLPVVGLLRHTLRDLQAVDELFNACNVIVTTMNIIRNCSDQVQERIIDTCSHLFIDEAHHIAAPTWARFRDKCKNLSVVQFTATPFRNDGKRVDGKIIFNYPLQKAQEEGYFKKINFIPVAEFSNRLSDSAIAETAVQILKSDLENGYDHLLMARVNTIQRTQEVLQLYEQYPEFNPVVIHSQLNNTEKKATLNKVITRESKIVICVDMFGEGFDLPELKIAALHDAHKSLGVTLQFTGRFTRSQSEATIGEASIIANIADQEFNETLENLYAENADWNFLLRNASSEAINNQVELSEFLSNFSDGILDSVPIQNILPKMSTVVYKTNVQRWYPERYKQVFSSDSETIYSINHQKNILIVIQKNILPVRWGQIKEIADVSWDIYVAYWNPSQNLLYINSTTTGTHMNFAEAIIENPSIVSGENVFRCFYGINRVILHNVGLNDAFHGPVRFRMYAGTDIVQGLSDAQKRNTFKSNIFGLGYENGEKTSIGCSYKGKVWAKKITNLMDWRNWCDSVGEKLSNDQINVDALLNGVLKPVIIRERPMKMPIVIEWPESFLLDYDSNITISFNGESFPLYETEIQLDSPDETGPLKFKISHENIQAAFEIEFDPNEEGKNYRYRSLSNKIVKIKKGTREKNAIEWFDEDPPTFRFADGSYMENNILVEPQTDYRPYQLDKIQVWLWDGTDITKESQKLEKRPDSIQYRVIQQLKSMDYQLIIDDDSSGEAADVITFNFRNDKIMVEFYHCKFSGSSTPGARVDDLYAVCGQAQKSIHWKGSLKKLIKHLQDREGKRISEGKPSRIEKGDLDSLVTFKKMANHYGWKLDIYIVQPGLSKSQIGNPQLEILGATENYLKETYGIDLLVIASE